MNSREINLVLARVKSTNEEEKKHLNFIKVLCRYLKKELAFILKCHRDEGENKDTYGIIGYPARCKPPAHV